MESDTQSTFDEGSKLDVILAQIGSLQDQVSTIYTLISSVSSGFQKLVDIAEEDDRQFSHQ